MEFHGFEVLSKVEAVHIKGLPCLFIKKICVQIHVVIIIISRDYFSVNETLSKHAIGNTEEAVVFIPLFLILAAVELKIIRSVNCPHETLFGIEESFFIADFTITHFTAINLLFAFSIVTKEGNVIIRTVDFKVTR